MVEKKLDPNAVEFYVTELRCFKSIICSDVLVLFAVRKEYNNISFCEVHKNLPEAT